MIRWKVDIWKELEKRYDHVFVDMHKIEIETRANGGKRRWLSQSALVGLHHGECRLRKDSLDILCDILDCQPGDLLEYVRED